MNLFEDWDATEKRTQQQQLQQQQRSQPRFSAAGKQQQQQQQPTRTQQQQQQQRRGAQQQPKPQLSPPSRDGPDLAQKSRAQGGRGLLSSVWGQSPEPARPATAEPAGAAGARSSATAAGSGSSSTMNPFAGGSTSLNPFAPSPSSSSSNPFVGGGGGGTAGRGGSSNPFASADGTSNQLVPLEQRGDPPIFSLQRLDFRTASSSSSTASWSILAVAVGNGTLAMATSDCCVIRWNADRGGRPDEVEISKRQEDTIHKIFLDPTGNHLLVCLHGGETYYLHSGTTRPKRLLKWTGVVVEAVAFDAKRCTEGSTKGFVIGTRSGDLYESSLESNGKERPFSLVYSLSRRQPRAGDGGGGGGGGGRGGGGGGGGIGGLGGGASGGGGGGDGGVVAALYLESMSSAVHGETRVFVMAVTASPLRLYVFMGGPTLEVMFREHRESSSTSFRELPGSMLGTALHVYRRASAAPGAAGASPGRDGGGGVGGGFAGPRGRGGAALRGRGGGGVKGQKEAPPQSFALLTSMGIYHGSLALGGHATLDNVISEAQLVPFPEDAGGGGDGDGGLRGRVGMARSSPLSMAITEFHFLLLFTGRLQVVSRLNGAVVQEESLETNDPSMGHVLTLLTDPYTGGGAMQGAAPGIGVANRLWLFTDRLPFKVRVSHEERDVWMLFLEKAVAGEEGYFDSAAHHCKSAVERAQVHYVQAGWYFRRGQHTLAARYYAKTPCCFEEIALKLMECGGGWKAEALKTYLLERLRHLSAEQAAGEHKMQRTMLCTWLTELYLRGFTYLPLDPGTAREREQAEVSLAEELRAFLRGNVAALDPATTMALLSGHGRGEEALFYATLVEDYDRVLAHHASSHGTPDHKAALEVLRMAPFDKVEPLVYKYSASLMAADPAGTIQTWMSKPQLKPTKLIPALVRYSQRRKAAMMHHRAPRSSSAGEGEDLGIKYLEFCVNELKLKDAAIHNHLLALYAQEEEWRERNSTTTDDSTAVVPGGSELGFRAGSAVSPSPSSWLAESGSGGSGGAAAAASNSALLAFIARPAEERFFDPMYALRLCSQHGRSLACVHLYSAMGLWEEAVDLALTVDTDMAKANANKAPDPETRKLLWLKIARREVERCRSTDVEGTMRVLQECDLLKIEDILPFFPDFVVIDSFKREICVSLEEYNGKIEGLRKEMEDYTLSSEAVQAEIAELKQRSIYVSSNQTCELCGKNILSTQFYVFPCGHAFHSECLLDNIRPHLSAEQQSAVASLVAMIEEGGGGGEGGEAPAGAAAAAVAAGGKGPAAAAGGVVDGSKRAQHYLRSLQTELDGYIAAECVLCGDMMVQSVDKPLVTEEELAEQSHQWTL
eukprot:g4139.t2